MKKIPVSNLELSSARLLASFARPETTTWVSGVSSIGCSSSLYLADEVASGRMTMIALSTSVVDVLNSSRRSFSDAFKLPKSWRYLPFTTRSTLKIMVRHGGGQSRAAYSVCSDIDEGFEFRFPSTKEIVRVLGEGFALSNITAQGGKPQFKIVDKRLIEIGVDALFLISEGRFVFCFAPAGRGQEWSAFNLIHCVGCWSLLCFDQVDAENLQNVVRAFEDVYERSVVFMNERMR